MKLTKQQRRYLTHFVSTMERRTAWCTTNEVGLVNKILSKGFYLEDDKSRLNNLIRYYMERAEPKSVTSLRDMVF